MNVMNSTKPQIVEPIVPAHRIVTLRFWKAFWITMRPYLLPVSGITGLVGLSLLDLEVLSFKWMATFIASPAFVWIGPGIDRLHSN